jgi:hypothetical protein
MVLPIAGERLSELDYSAFSFQLAADHGRAISQFNLGFMYANGLGVQQDKCLRACPLLAQSGHPFARQPAPAFGRGFISINPAGRSRMWW